MNISLNKKSGFTLIELLVVIAIIGILASITLIFMGNLRKRARDAQRISDLHQIRTALESYYIDNGTYPVPGNNPQCTQPSWIYSSNPGCWNALETMLSPYIKTLPKDPKNNAIWAVYVWANRGFHTYTYYYNPNSSNNPNIYDLMTQLEDESNPERCEIKNWKTKFDGSSWCDLAKKRLNTNYTGY